MNTPAPDPIPQRPLLSRASRPLTVTIPAINEHGESVATCFHLDRRRTSLDAVCGQARDRHADDHGRRTGSLPPSRQRRLLRRATRNPAIVRRHAICRRCCWRALPCPICHAQMRIIAFINEATTALADNLK
jgi:hypothetical protein